MHEGAIEKLIFGIGSKRVKVGQSYFGDILSQLLHQEGFGRHVVINMSDPIRDIVLSIRPDLTAQDIERMKDDPTTNVRGLMSTISQFMRADDLDALAKRVFGALPPEGGIVTAIKFLPETAYLIDSIKLHGGAFIVLDIDQETWERRLEANGFAIPKVTIDKVEQERPPLDDVIDACERAEVPVFRFDNAQHLEASTDNPYYGALLEMVVQIRNGMDRKLLVH